MKDHIMIAGANEHNLKNVDVQIPKKKITVFTGVSGSGKSSLCMDTIAAESRRELNETFPSFVQQYLPKYNRPHVRVIENMPITMILDQKKPTAHSRSTVGTYTDIHAFLRLLFSRIGEPFIGYSDIFSFNHPQGQCKRCKGLGEVTELDIHKLVDFDKCLNDEGVINFPAFTTGAWRWKRYAYSGLFDLDKKIKDYSEEELALFLHSPQIKLKNPPSNWPKSAKYEGIYPRMYRSIIHTKEGQRRKHILDGMLDRFTCPDCQGSRLSQMIRDCKINDKSIVDVVNMPIPNLIEFIENIHQPLAQELKTELLKRLQPLVQIGLRYLTLSRAMSTLSGGEAQRVKIAKYINSSLTDVAYVLDEPSSGLHVHDIRLLKDAIYQLRDKGNTIMMVEHHPEIIQLADHIIDMGPGSGRHGGQVVYEGDLSGLKASNGLTGQLLRRTLSFKKPLRQTDKWTTLKAISHHNLKAIDVEIPMGVLTTVIGVAGSGKSSLMEVMAKHFSEELVYINQKGIGANSRSTPSTYLGLSDHIRKLFAKANDQKTSLFSFNSEGACPACKGRGVIVSEMGFMNAIETVCEACGGNRYSEEVLKYQYKGMDIAAVHQMTVEEALTFFKHKKIVEALQALEKVGLGYLCLNQSLSTMSGGELQRIKLASQLKQNGTVYLLDEPLDGLHLNDVKKLLELFNELVDQGNTVIIVDHHLDVIYQSDYLIELGPEGGDQGGELLYQGPSHTIMQCKASVTQHYLHK